MLRLAALPPLMISSTMAHPLFCSGLPWNSGLPIVVTHTRLQLIIVVRVDHHDKKIGYRFIFPGFRKPLGDFSLSGEETALGLPPFCLNALGSLQVHQHLCPT